MATTAQTTETWRRAGEARNVEMVTACLADDVQLISPLTARFRFRGREQVRDVLVTMLSAVTCEDQQARGVALGCRSLCDQLGG